MSELPLHPIHSGIDTNALGKIENVETNRSKGSPPKIHETATPVLEFDSFVGLGLFTSSMDGTLKIGRVGDVIFLP